MASAILFQSANKAVIYINIVDADAPQPAEVAFQSANKAVIYINIPVDPPTPVIAPNDVSIRQ